MNINFQEKVKDYQQAIKDDDEQKAEQLLKELRQDVHNMVGYIDSYAIDNRIICIQTASVDELRSVYEDLTRKVTTNTLSAISDSEREKQMGRNVYGPDNQYPNN